MVLLPRIVRAGFPPRLLCRLGAGFLLLLLAAPAALTPLPAQVDEVVASVDQSLITLRDLQFHAFEAHVLQPELRNIPWETLAPRFAGRAVDEMLLYHHFWRPGAEPEQADIKAVATEQFDALALAMGSQEALRAELKEWDLSETDLKRWLEARAERRWHIDAGISARLDPSLSNRADDTPANAERVRVGHILIRPAGEGEEERERARQRALAVSVHIEEGLSFEQAVRMFSDDEMTAGSAGDLGWIETDSLAPEMREPLLSLSPGQITDPVILGNDVHLFRLADFETEARRELREALARTRTELLRRLREEMEVRLAEGYELTPLRGAEDSN